jgi:phage gp29-like protein
MLPDPDPVLRKMGKDITIYEDLLTDSHLFSTIQQRKAGVLAQNWELRQEESNPKEYEIIKEIFDNIDFENIIDQILNAPLFGQTILEIVWQKDGSYLIPGKIEEKPLEWFYYDDYNNLRLKSEKINDTGELLNPLKFITIRYKPTYKNPYGQRLLSRCFWPVTFKRGGLKFWIMFTEKYGNPFIFGKQPRNTSQEDTNILLDALKNMIQDAVAVIPDDSSVSILEASKTSSVETFKELMNFLNNEISKAILTQTLTTEVQDVGAYSASKTMSDMLYLVQQSDKRLVERAFNRLINLIYEINFNSNNKPKFILYEEEDVDKTLAERDQILVNTGVKFTKEYYIKNYNLMEDDFDLADNISSFAEKAGADILDKIPDKLLQMQIEGTLKPIISLINEGESYDIIMENLAKLYPKMNANQLEELLTKLIFISELNGRLS